MFPNFKIKYGWIKDKNLKETIDENQEENFKNSLQNQKPCDMNLVYHSRSIFTGKPKYLASIHLIFNFTVKLF